MKAISKPTIIGITGSSGKTTVKEMCAAIFQTRFPDEQDKATGRVLKTEGNFNNLIGLPLSLLPLEPKHTVAVLEMGMNRPGEIETLTKIADPDIACIINVHGAHLQGLGTIEGVAAAKGELYKTCRKNSVFVVNNDDSRVVALASNCEQKKITFGFALPGSKTPDISVSLPKKQGATSANEEICFELQIGEQTEPVTLHVPGQHNIANAMAAAGIAHAAGIGIEYIVRGLTAFQPAEKRMQIIDGPAGSRIINDCYNANPASMKAAINTLSEIATASSVAVLGDMLELGSGSYQLHKEVGRLVADAGISFVAVLGEYAEAVAEGVRERKKAKTVVQQCADQKQCYSWLQKLIKNNHLEAGSYILVKGSRGMQLEKLVEQL
jgi:murE/murF fusion protein